MPKSNIKILVRKNKKSSKNKKSIPINVPKDSEKLETLKTEETEETVKTVKTVKTVETVETVEKALIDKRVITELEHGIEFISIKRTKDDISNDILSLDIRTIEDPVKVNEPETIETIDSDGYMMLCKEEKYSLMEQLEDRKHALKSAYKNSKDPHKKKNIKKEYEDASRLLSVVKECDVMEKVNLNKKDCQKIRDDFKKKFKKLKITDFQKIIDLTGSKEDIKPDESTSLWDRSKKVVFKTKKYRDPSQEKFDKFKKKMQLKPMPKNIRKTINNQRDGNLNAVHYHNNMGSELHGYSKYDPFNNKGNYVY